MPQVPLLLSGQIPVDENGQVVRVDKDRVQRLMRMHGIKRTSATQT